MPYNATGADAKPMADFAAACKSRGLWPFVHFNRTHVAPPCTTSETDLRRGLALLDEALERGRQLLHRNRFLGRPVGTGRPRSEPIDTIRSRGRNAFSAQ